MKGVLLIVVEIKVFKPKYTEQISNIIIRNLLEINIKDYGIEEVRKMVKEFDVKKLNETLSNRKKVYVH